MTYVVIENSGICPVQGFSVLGVSTARGKATKIGQFGTGCKQAVNLLIRKGLTPVIFCGEQKLEFTTKPEMMEDKAYDRVFMNGEPLGFSTEFGALDWNDTGMAIREFVSNAWDSGNCTVRLSEILEAKKDHTRVYIPYCPEVKEYVNNLRRNFLQFDELHEKKYLNKEDPTKVRIYRRGVYVRTLELPEQHISLLDYNIDIPIDESRNFTSSGAEAEVKKMIWRDPELWPFLLSNLGDEKKNSLTFEFASIDAFQVKDYALESQFKEAFYKIYRDYTISAEREIAVRAQKKGRKVLLLPYGLYSLFRIYGVKDCKEELSSFEAKGLVQHNASTNLIRNVQGIVDHWKFLGVLPFGTNLPRLVEFDCSTDAGEITQGTVDFNEGIVGIARVSRDDYSVITEQLIQFYGRCGICSIDFESFATRIIAKSYENWPQNR